MDARTRSLEAEAYLGRSEVHERWETVYHNRDLDGFYEEVFDRLVDRLGAGPDATLLDAGCGYCLHAARLARRGLRVTGCDFSEAALAEARRYLEERRLADRVDLRRGNLLSLPFPDGSFDFVCCWGVLMHIPEVERALAELVRVVRPGGRIGVVENNDRSLHVRMWEPTLRAFKRAIGRPLPAARRGPRGREEWLGGNGQGLLVRKTNMDWLAGEMGRLGADLRHREAVQFTELYASIPWRRARRIVHAFNRWWFRAIRHPGPSLGNLLVFEKRGGSTT